MCFVNDHESTARKQGNNLFSTVPVFYIGLNDAFNPFALAVILCFFVFLAGISKTRMRIFFGGLFFLLTFCVNKALVASSVYDRWLNQDVVTKSLLFIYWFLAAGFVILGILNFWDWWSMKKSKEPRYQFIHLRLLTAGSPSSQKGFIKFVGYLIFILFCMFSGYLMALLTSFWPEDFTLYLNYFYLMQGNLMELAFASFYLYAVGFAIPLILAWIGVLIYVHPGVNKARQKFNPLMMIMSSAAFLSVSKNTMSEVEFVCAE